MTSQTPKVLSVRDLAIEFQAPEGVIRAVDGVSFDVPAGRTVALVGESGSGKTVISQTIMNILPRSARRVGGHVLFFDPENEGQPLDITAQPPSSPVMRNLRGGRISIIFQEPMTSLSPLHTVGDQVCEALSLHRKVDAGTARDLTREMLAMAGFTDTRIAFKIYPFELSGGQRQRAMIAMALICRPALLIADEPTTALDVTIQAQILKLMKNLQSELDMAVLLITHDLGVVASIADEVVVMCRGKVVESGGLEDIFEKPGHAYLQGLLCAVPRLQMPPGERLVPLREVRRTDGGFLDTSDDEVPAPDLSRPVLEVYSLRKTFVARQMGMFGTRVPDRWVAIDDMTFSIERGECLGLVGESGCGKTTLSKLIMGVLKPDGGAVTFNGRDGAVEVLGLKGQARCRYRQQAQYVFQDPFSSLNPRMSVYDIVGEPLVIHGIGDENTRPDMVRELLGLVGLDARFMRRYPHSFSGGQRQRICLARALALRPSFLLCDEPVSALDVSIQAQVLNLLKDLQKELGLTYLFISHNLAVVDYMADRIAVMCRGQIVELAPREVLFRDPVHPYTRTLLNAVPVPDPRSPLDLKRLRTGAANPAKWPAPFTVNSWERPGMIDLGDGHLVRADDSSGAEIRVGG